VFLPSSGKVENVLRKLRLDSWKSIASYLDRSLRTVQRWHADNGLPVHHFGGTKGCVFAYSDELDSWFAGIACLTGQQDTKRHPALEAKRNRAGELVAIADLMWNSCSERTLASIAALYREAADEDPANAAALVGLSRSLIAAALFGVVESSFAYPSALEALRRAPQLDLNDFDAKSCAAWLKMVYERKWLEARAGFEEALAGNPADSNTLAGRALLYLADGEISTAFQCAWSAWTKNPLASTLSFYPCWIMYLSGNYKEALELVSQVRASGAYGSSIASVEALSLASSESILANMRQIERIAAEFPGNRVLQGVLGYGYARTGRAEDAWRIFNDLQNLSERMKRNCGYLLALILLGLDLTEEALACLNTSYAVGSLWSLGFCADPILLPLRGNLHFQSLIRKIGSQAHSENLPEVFEPEYVVLS
jgi:tetratricopeptide (TPR) repeat protein